MFFVSAITPIAFGFNVRTSNEGPIVESVNFGSYHVNEITSYPPNIPIEDITNTDIIESNQIDILKETIEPVEGPMDSAWPMYCYDVRHTGRSPYSTVDNNFYNKWWIKSDDYIEGSGVIDRDRVFYFSCVEGNNIYFYSVFPNGTLKWKCKLDWLVESSPVIAEDGTIYVGDSSAGYGKLYSISPDGKINWKFHTYGEMYSSPVIGSDGTIYVGDGDYYINAINPNGTLKWRYKTGLVVYSSPAIGDDGTVYCGSHDTYLYALYPDNGTVKWKYNAGGWVRTSPCIGDDGTIYVSSFDNCIHAVYPNNGTRKWRTNVGGGTSPTIGRDGTIYAGYSTLYAVNPTDGSVKWTFPVGGGAIRGGTPCNSLDGTIIFGVDNEPYGGDIVAVNPDGTERWREKICDYGWGVEFAPIIGEDGTVYIGTSTDEFVYPGAVRSFGYLYAFNNMDPDAPSTPEIEGPDKGKKGIEYQYTFESTSPLGRDLYYYIEWGDGDWTTERWIGPYRSGEEVVLNHTWPEEDVYIIRARCKDTENLWGPWSEYRVSTPRNKAIYNSLFLEFLERFPLLERILLNLQ